MATKHPVLDTDLHFVVNPSTRSIIKQYEGKAHVMQYDQNSERLTFDVPRHIEEHDMSLCDVIQVHYENVSNGTSSSTRQTYRGVEVIDQATVEVGEEIISFSWLIPRNATTFAGLLKFQLRFVCHDPDYPTVVVYRWHTNVNSDISIVSGLAYTEEELPPSVTATLQSLEIEEVYDEDGIQEGVNIILDGVYHTIYHGGYAPKALDMVELNENKTQTIDENSTHTQYPTAAAVHLLTEEIDTRLSGEIEGIENALAEHATSIENNASAIKTNEDAIKTNAANIDDILAHEYMAKLHEIALFRLLQPDEDGRYLIEVGKTYRLIPNNPTNGRYPVGNSYPTYRLATDYTNHDTLHNIDERKTAAFTAYISDTKARPYIDIYIKSITVLENTHNNGTGGTAYYDAVKMIYVLDGEDCSIQCNVPDLFVLDPTVYVKTNADLKYIAEENHTPWLTDIEQSV